ncbi:hypothetical protein [Burkholderia vietnamiensis]|uniref:hypothetical protein n=1 Tax=Burkholderia vietnamiensis TaxID=60552 RepID=UPI001CF2B491|nr:hypothetical protein [Burkholderia vietnamiensis]MCA8448955.1 hypothetical protein [Burkholderia vietnamiensis]
MDLQDPTLNGRPPIDKKGNLALALGFSLLVLLAVVLLVTLIVTLDGRNTPAPAGGFTSQAQTPVALENDATYGLDLDKQTVARSKAILDAREGVTR